MERNHWIVGAMGVAATCMALSSSMPGNAAASDTSDFVGKRFECSNKTLRGTWGILMQGTRPVQGGSGIESVIGIVTRTFDGAGNFTQLDNVKGSTSGYAADRPGFGTYIVNTDCTGTTRFEPGLGVVVEEKFVIVDFGQEIRTIVTAPPPIMVTTVARRISLR